MEEFFLFHKKIKEP